MGCMASISGLGTKILHVKQVAKKKEMNLVGNGGLTPTANCGGD